MKESLTRASKNVSRYAQQEELDDKERQYSQAGRSGKRKEKSVSSLVRKLLKAGWAGELPIEAERAATRRECLNCGAANSGAGKTVGSRGPVGRKTMRLLRNKVTDAGVPKCWRAG